MDNLTKSQLEIARVTSFEFCVVTECRLEYGHQGAHDLEPDPEENAVFSWDSPTFLADERG